MFDSWLFKFFYIWEFFHGLSWKFEDHIWHADAGKEKVIEETANNKSMNKNIKKFC